MLGVRESFLEEVMLSWEQMDGYKFSKQTKGTLWAEFQTKAPEARGSMASCGDGCDEGTR